MSKNVPKIVNDFLNYNSSLNKSNGTIYEYRYDLVNFLKYMKFIKLGNQPNVNSVPKLFILP